jgi:hypothetical protein
MTSMMQRPISMLRTSALALLCLAAPLATGCNNLPKQDDFRRDGGISPDPTGIIAGSVLYQGPRPRCEYNDGRPTRVIGRVVMTLFDYYNPPPPEGRATTALNIAFFNADEMFSLTDCLGPNEEVDPTSRITRAMDFDWPQIALYQDERDYQIRAFYDADEDMIPFFSVKNLPTQGDIVGAALEETSNPKSPPLHIRMPPFSKAENGYKKQGVVVAIGNYVWLERPAFQLSLDNRFLSAEMQIIVSLTGDGGYDVERTLEGMRDQTCGMLANNCGLSFEQLDEGEVQSAFTAGGVQLNFDPADYAFVSEPVDILTVRTGKKDEQTPDGKPDPHPLLGSNLGLPWYTPINILTRTAPTADMAAREALAGIPNVRLIGTPLLNDAMEPDKRVVLGEIPIAVPAVAAVELDPLDTTCRVPYLAPGNYTRAFESRLTYCHDLPTGLYGVSVLQGVGGGTRVEEPDTNISENGFVYNGGRLAGQAWTLPNELADPKQVGDGNTLSSQSRSALFVVYDPDPDSMGDCSIAEDPDNDLMPRPVEYRGVCKEGEDPWIENPMGSTGEGVDGTGCLPTHCCDGVQHLCGIPLCPLCDETSCPGLDFVGDRAIRQGPSEVKQRESDGKMIPNCIPFEMPSLCCG